MPLLATQRLLLMTHIESTNFNAWTRFARPLVNNIAAQLSLTYNALSHRLNLSVR